MNPPRSMADLPQGPSVVLATTPHCPHCRSIRSHIEAVASAGSAAAEATEIDGVTIFEVSAPDSPDFVAELKIKAAPTLLAFRDGVEVTRHVGAGGEADVRRVFDAASNETGSRKAIRRYSISSESRWIRTGLGLALIAAGAITSVVWLAFLGAVFLASGWYDYVAR